MLHNISIRIQEFVFVGVIAIGIALSYFMQM